MYLSNTKRTFKLIGHLLSNPKNIIPYLGYSVPKSSPLELALPCWSLSAIRKMDQHLKRDHRVFEWGSGGSTLYLAKRCKELTSIEHAPNWFEQVEKILTKERVTNCLLRHRQINLESEKEFLASPFAKALQSTHDVIVIDGEDNFGPESNWSARESCFRLAEQWVCKNGGLIIVDDSWRYPALRRETNAKQMVIHESIGPCRVGVTSTDFHYY